jgi:hypothetical protein
LVDEKMGQKISNELLIDSIQKELKCLGIKYLYSLTDDIEETSLSTCCQVIKDNNLNEKLKKDNFITVKMIPKGKALEGNNFEEDDTLRVFIKYLI